MPDLKLEVNAGGIVAGVDEVGRGSWAGPVVAAAVILDRTKLTQYLKEEIDDSKRLSAKRRRQVTKLLVDCSLMGTGAASSKEIAQLNILGATYLAMKRAIFALPKLPDLALVDGNQLPKLPCVAECVVKGDSKSLSIAAASIIAKVTRDKIMTKLGVQYPGFGWENNAGYGTPQHIRGLEKLGVTQHHRKTFAPIINMLRSR